MSFKMATLCISVSTSKKNKRNILRVWIKFHNFALAKQKGRLDEWLSLRSAKPSTAVRICYRPQVYEPFREI